MKQITISIVVAIAVVSLGYFNYKVKINSPIPIASMLDGTVMYSDGSFRGETDINYCPVE